MEMLSKLAEANNTFVRNLLELAKEVGEYHQSQKDKIKANVSLCVCLCVYMCVRACARARVCVCVKLHCIMKYVNNNLNI